MSQSFMPLPDATQRRTNFLYSLQEKQSVAMYVEGQVCIGRITHLSKSAATAVSGDSTKLLIVDRASGVKTETGEYIEGEDFLLSMESQLQQARHRQAVELLRQNVKDAINLSVGNPLLGRNALLTCLATLLDQRNLLGDHHYQELQQVIQTAGSILRD